MARRIRSLTFTLIFVSAVALHGHCSPVTGGAASTEVAHKADLKRFTCKGLLHPAVSSRSFAESLRLLQSYPGKGAHPERPLPVFDEGSITSGKRSLLSIGEGGSQFVGHLLELRKAELLRAVLGTSATHPLIENLLAVDPAYFAGATHRYPFLKRPLNRREISHVRRFRKDFPENYQGGLVQELDLRNPDHSQRQFDEIVSLHAVGYLDLNPDQLENLLLRLLRHLKPSGSLRIDPPLALTIELLENLRARGELSNYGISHFRTSDGREHPIVGGVIVR